jgi:chromosome segregation ATPase
VTATIRSTLPLSAWLPLQTAASAFREECSSLEQTVQELFADLDRLGVELESKADELEEGRRHLAERGRQLADQRKETTRLCQQLEQQETQLTATLAELRELRAELSSRSAATPATGGETDSLRQQIAELQVERAVLAERLESAGRMAPGEFASAAGSASLSAEALTGLAEQFAGQFAELKQHMQSPPADSPHNGELEALRKDRLELEAELELVRARSAELQETVARQKRELAEQRAEVSDELKVLRSLIEDQAQLFAQHESSPVESAAEERPVRVPAPHAHESQPAKSPDPVVNNVMAQFAKLQRDIAQRRKKK